MNAQISTENKRLVEIELMGKKYPLNFSMKAVRKICEKYGDIDLMLEKVSDLPTEAQLYEILWILQLFLEQGALYRKIETGEDIRIFTVDELEIIFKATDSEMLYKIFLDVIGNGSAQTVEVQQNNNLEKNAIATQE